MNIRLLTIAILVLLGILYNIEGIGYVALLLLLFTSVFYKIVHSKVKVHEEGSTFSERLQQLQSAYKKQQITELEYKQQRDILVREYNEGVSKDER